MFTQVNTFQCVLATNEFESFVFFLYNDGGIQWTTGDDSGGTNGLGGHEAVVGISAGDGDNFVMIPESGSPCILNIDKMSNVGIPGVWMFKAGTGMYFKNFRSIHRYLQYIGTLINIFTYKPLPNCTLQWQALEINPQGINYRQ